MKKLAYLFGFILFIIACNEGDSDLPSLEANLEDYISNNTDFRLVRDSLIACALGGQSDFLMGDNQPISVLFLPEGTATEFLYFETDSIEVNPDNLSNYRQMDLTVSPIFNGFLRRFERPSTNRPVWGRVTFVKDGNLHISNAINIKFNEIPTENNASVLRLDQTDNLSPLFTWEDGSIKENVIYFHVVLNQDNELVSGTYTFEKRFQFYDLSNVVLNVSPTNPTPALEPNTNYKFVLMGVSIDNWVNLILEQEFDTN